MDKIQELISSFDFLNFSQPFLILTGTFGTGKTHLIEKLISKIAENKDEYTIFVHFDFEKIANIFELGNAIKCFTNSLDSKNIININDIDFFLGRYSKLLEQVKEKDNELLLKINALNKLKDHYSAELLEPNLSFNKEEVYTKIETYFPKKSDRRILLYLFDVLTEAILTSILQASSQIIGEDKKLKLFLIFDNYEKFGATIENWAYNSIYRYLTLNFIEDFKSYELVFPFRNTKLSAIFEHKFIFSTRYDFIQKFLLKNEPKEKIKVINLLPWSKEEIRTLLENKEIKVDVEKIYSETLGIPFAIELLLYELSYNSVEINKKEFYKKNYHKIISKIPQPLEKTFKLLSCFERYSEESIRFLPENYEHYEIIFKYFSSNNDLTEVIWLKNQIFKIKDHYRFFISKHLEENEPQNYSTFTQYNALFQKAFGFLENLSLFERKILRNLAYLKEFNLGTVLVNIFQDDYHSIEAFVKSHPEYFNADESVYRIKPEIRSILLDMNTIIDQKSKAVKIEHIKNLASSSKKEIAHKIELIKQEIEMLNKKKYEFEKQNKELDKEISATKDKIMELENLIIDVKNKKIKYSKEFTWRIYFLLAFISLLFFWIGNNIIYLFDETFNYEIIRGLGLSFKIFSIFILGVIAYFLIDYFAFSKNKKESLKRVEEHINQNEKARIEEEHKLNELVQTKTQTNTELKQIELKLVEVIKEKEELEIALKIEFIDIDN